MFESTSARFGDLATRGNADRRDVCTMFAAPLLAGKKPQAAYEVAHSDLQRVSQELQRSQGHALLPGLKPIKMRAVQPSAIRQVILCDSLPLACGCDAFADNLLDVLQTTGYGPMLL